MATRTMQTNSANHRYNRRISSGRIMGMPRRRLAYAVAVAITPLVLGGCAELMDSRSDITDLRSDLQANAQLLSQLSARVDALESRQTNAESTVRQTQQELSQAIEVLLKKALVREDRQITRESGKSQSKDVEMPEKYARPLASETQRAFSQGGNSAPGGKYLSLGMTQEDVRRTLGDPVSIENAGAYIFWQYSRMSNQKYVVFEKASGQVSGWRGL